MNVVCSWLICSGYRLHQVDVVVMNSVYSIMLDEVGTLEAASRVLRRDGRLVLSHPLGREFVTNLQQQVRASNAPKTQDAESRVWASKRG
jgi:hypothetical protein